MALFVVQKQMSISFEQIKSKIQTLLREKYPPSEDTYFYVAETYPDSFITDLDDKYWRIPYTLTDEAITLADSSEWQKVERRTEWVEAKAIEIAKAGRRHSAGDVKMLQTMHDHSVALGASCGGGKAAGGQGSGGAGESNHLKAISETETEYRIANYLALFGGRDLEGIASDRKNADGSTGEYFSKATDFESTYTQTGMLYVDWEHGRDDLSQDDLLGYVDWKSARVDERGVWVERVLNRRNKYVQYLKTLIEAGLIGNSTEPVQSRIAKAADGHITRWPLKRDTLTVSPMEPRMLNENTLEALKSLAVDIPCIKSACLKAGVRIEGAGKPETLSPIPFLSIQANLAYINSVLEEV